MHMPFHTETQSFFMRNFNLLSHRKHSYLSKRLFGVNHILPNKHLFLAHLGKYANDFPFPMVMYVSNSQITEQKTHLMAQSTYLMMLVYHTAYVHYMQCKVLLSLLEFQSIKTDVEPHLRNASNTGGLPETSPVYTFRPICPQQAYENDQGPSQYSTLVPICTNISKPFLK